MKNKLLSLFIFGIFLLSIANISALTDQSTATQYQNKTIIQTCSDATYVTLSGILLPDQTFITINVNMTNVAIGVYEYNFSNNSQLGRYDAMGITDGCDKDWMFSYNVSSTGRDTTIILVIFALIFSLVILILAFIFKSPPLAFLSGILFAIAGIYLMIYGLGDVADFYTQAIAITSIAIGWIVMVMGLMSYFDDDEDTSE
jgi:hypothetical protein